MLDGQGCLLPVRHFHKEDPPPLLLTSWSTGLYLTYRVKAAVEANPDDSHIRSAVACSAVSDAEEEPGQNLDGYGKLSLPVANLQVVEIGAPQACDSHVELASRPYISADNRPKTNPGRSVQAWSSPSTVGTEPAKPKLLDIETCSSRSAGATLFGAKVAEVENVPDSAEVGVTPINGSLGDGGTVLCTNEQIDVVSIAKESFWRSSNADEGLGKASTLKRSSKAQEQATRLAITATYPNKLGKTLTVKKELTFRVSPTDVSQDHNSNVLTDSQGWKRLRIENNSTDLHFKNVFLFKSGATKSCYSHNDGSSDQQQPLLPGLDDELASKCLAFVPLSDLGQLAMVGRQCRDLVRSGTIFKLRRMYGTVEHLVFIYTSGAGGWQAYNANRNVWRTLPPANVNPAFDLSDRESLSAGTHVLWLGKEMFEFVYYRYDLLSNIWDRGPTMVNPRCLFASASCGEFAFVAGGFGPANRNGDQVGTLRLLNSAERYNSLTGEWEPLPPMSTPRHKCSGFIMDGKFFVIGGRDANHQPIMSEEEYNPVTKTWRMIENMYFAPEVNCRDMFEPSPPLVAVVNNELYAVESTTNILKMYDKQMNAWRSLGYMPVRADLCNGWGVAFKSLGDRLFVMGDVEGILACCWQPKPNAMEPVWQLLCQRERGTNSFLYNCAVMAC